MADPTPCNEPGPARVSDVRLSVAVTFRPAGPPAGLAAPYPAAGATDFPPGSPAAAGAADPSESAARRCVRARTSV